MLDDVSYSNLIEQVLFGNFDTIILSLSPPHLQMEGLTPAALCHKSLNSMHFQPYFMIFLCRVSICTFFILNASIISLKAIDQVDESFR